MVGLCIGSSLDCRVCTQRKLAPLSNRFTMPPHHPHSENTQLQILAFEGFSPPTSLRPIRGVHSLLLCFKLLHNFSAFISQFIACLLKKDRKGSAHFWLWRTIIFSQYITPPMVLQQWLANSEILRGIIFKNPGTECTPRRQWICFTNIQRISFD